MNQAQIVIFKLFESYLIRVSFQSFPSHLEADLFTSQLIFVVTSTYKHLKDEQINTEPLLIWANNGMDRTGNA